MFPSSKEVGATTVCYKYAVARPGPSSRRPKHPIWFVSKFIALKSSSLPVKRNGKKPIDFRKRTRWWPTCKNTRTHKYPKDKPSRDPCSRSTREDLAMAAKKYPCPLKYYPDDCQARSLWVKMSRMTSLPQLKWCHHKPETRPLVNIGRNIIPMVARWVNMMESVACMEETALQRKTFLKQLKKKRRSG